MQNCDRAVLTATNSMHPCSLVHSGSHDCCQFILSISRPALHFLLVASVEQRRICESLRQELHEEREARGRAEQQVKIPASLDPCHAHKLPFAFPPPRQRAPGR